MNPETIVTGIGLVFDIIGVGVLFFTTSTKHLEAELSFKLATAFTDEGGEWLQPYSFEEHKRSLSIVKKRIRCNQLYQRSGLGLIVWGFILQAVGLFI